MKEFNYTINDPNGIHARPAGVLVKEVKGFESAITVWKGDASCDMKKLMKLMGMGIKQGDTITIKVEGPDEDAAAEAVKKAFEENF
ncbi:MAG: HPr family phosphocarrier protein [Lachnospiraceae bacterium]|nr:HPr family phosphocarrier protein [Lachnospiraceae bacterium]